MKNKKTAAARIIIVSVATVIIVLSAYVVIMQKFIRTYTYTEIENRGYASEDVADISISHSYLNRILGYNEWRISVEFKEVPDVFFWFSYRDEKIVFEGVSAEPMPDKDSVIEYSEKFKHGDLLREQT